MGLTYDVSFELNLFDKLDLGWYVIAVTSTPSKVFYFQSSYVPCASMDYIQHLVIFNARFIKLLMHVKVF
jgi:hypothetical protein